MMRLLFFLFFFFTAFFLQAQQSKSTVGKQPNVLWIMAEDMNLHLGVYGNKLVHTPTLDSLARKGVRYNYAFTTAGVCAPSRASIITGMYSTSIGTQHMRQGKILTPIEGIPSYIAAPYTFVKAFPEYLRAAGYYATNNRKTDYQFGEPFSVWDELSMQAHWRNRKDKEQPFFASFTFESTHEINVWPDSTKDRFFKQFKVDTGALVEDVRRRPPLEERYVVKPADVELPPYYPDHPVVRSDIARHLTNISRMDGQVKRLLDALREDGEEENTFIFFMGDNGDGLPRSKRWLNDGGLRVPLVVYIPEKWRQGLQGKLTGLDTQLISLIDLAPTLLDMLGLPVPAHFQGRRFISRRSLAAPRSYIHAGRDRMDTRYDRIRAVRSRKYNYIRNYNPEHPYTQYLDFQFQMPMMRVIAQLEKEGKLNEVQASWLSKTKPPEELYDTENDPHQVNNLAGQPLYETVLAEMRREMDHWLAQTGDWGVMPEAEQKYIMCKGDEQPKTSDVYFQRRPDGSYALYCYTEGASISYRKTGDRQWKLYTPNTVLKDTASWEARAIRYGYIESGVTGNRQEKN